MTDKQIIFNCDVDCIKKNTEECFELECIYGQESILKQLQAKEQECEKWQAELADKASELRNIEETIKPLMKRPDDLEWIVLSFADEFKQLKVENEELKKTVDDLLHKPEIQDKILWKIDNEALLGSKDAWIYKLEQTLTEIKEIAENAYCLTNGTNKDMAQFAKQILQKISKCEGK